MKNFKQLENISCRLVGFLKSMDYLCKACDGGLIPSNMDKLRDLKSSIKILDTLNSHILIMTYESSRSYDIELLGELLLTSCFGVFEKYDDLLEDIYATVGTLTDLQAEFIGDVTLDRERIAKCL